MSYQSMEVRRAALHDAINRFDAGEGYSAVGDAGTLTTKSPSEYRADLGRRRDQLDRLLRQAGGSA